MFRKSVIDEDKRELRELKERYLEDGDLYSEGGGRARNFKWHGLEDSQLDMFDNKVLWGEDEVVDSALLTDAEFERRKMKHERDQFLQEQVMYFVIIITTNIIVMATSITTIITSTITIIPTATATNDLYSHGNHHHRHYKNTKLTRTFLFAAGS